jgi:phosphatidate cytidylyltransferase
MMMNIQDKENSLVKRIIAALIFGPPIALIFLKRGFFLYLFIIALTLFSQWELFKMFRMRLKFPQRVVCFISGLIMVSDTYFGSSTHLAMILILTLIVYFIIEIVLGKEHKLKNVSLSLFVTIYPALFTLFLIKIDQIHFFKFYAAEKYLLLYILFVIWIFDTASYFTGITIGKHHFFPSISPHKTVEGFTGGMISVVLMAIAASFFTDKEYFPHLLAISLLTAIAGQIGDLSESLIKRNIGVKDSSNVIPGHGGILDRFDSLFFAAPVVYCYISLFT